MYVFTGSLGNLTGHLEKLYSYVFFFLFRIFVYVSYNFVACLYGNGGVSTIFITMIVKTSLTIHMSFFLRNLV